MFATAALLLLMGVTDPGVRAAEAAYDDGNFELVLVKTDQALNRKLLPDDRKRALELRAVALTAFDRRAEAVTAFEELLGLDKDYRAPERLGPKVGAAFEEAASRFAATGPTQQKEARADAVDVPRAEQVTEPNVELEAEDTGPSTVVRMLPFGVGQFARGANDRGFVFLGVEAAAFTTCAVALVMFESMKVGTGDRVLSTGTFRAEDASRAYTLQTVYLVAFWTGVAAMAVGAAEGLLAGSPLMESFGWNQPSSPALVRF